MRYKDQIVYIGLILVVGIIFMYIINKQWNEKWTNAPKINKELKLDEIYVTKTSFERNNLYINDILYNAGSIDANSKVNSQDSIYTLKEMRPPFILKKKENSDTLQIIKNNKVFYILVLEE